VRVCFLIAPAGRVLAFDYGQTLGSSGLINSDLMHSCDLCGNPATIHETAVLNGKKLERHLCQRCAVKMGMVVNEVVPVAAILQQMLGPAEAETTPDIDSVKYCPTCRTTFGKFRSTGLFGCPHCYVAFAQQLMPLLERYHEGGANHIGKVPRRAGAGMKPQPGPVPRNSQSGGAGASSGPATDPHRDICGPAELSPQERLARVMALRNQLEMAIASEDYRAAASLRDELINLGDPELPRSTRRARPANPSVDPAS